MNYVRRLFLAVITLAFISAAWYGGEMMIHGVSQRSVIDIAIAIVISLSVSGKLEKGVEENERKREIAGKFAERFIEHVKEGQKTEDSGEKNK